MKRWFTSLFAANFMGVMNDNYLKMLGCYIAILWAPPGYSSLIIAAAAGCLVLPYIFFSPLAGRWAYLHSKKKIFVWAKVAELPIMGVAIAGFVIQSVPLVIFAIFLMGLQSSLYSPAKYGLIREVGGEANLPFGVGGFEAFSFLGMLSGTVLASFLSEQRPMPLIYSLLIAFAVVGLLLSLTIKTRERYIGDEPPASVDPLRFLRDTYRQAASYPGLNRIVFGLSVFWWFVASLQMGLVLYCKQAMGLGEMATGVILALAAVGITLGCLIAGIIQKRGFIYRFVAPSAFIVAILLILLFIVPFKPLPFSAILFTIAFLSGFFKVPLDTAIQQKAEGAFLATVLAYFNQVSFIFILLASATYALISFLPHRYLFLMLGVVFFFAPFYLMGGVRPLLSYFTRSLLHLRYKITVTGRENFGPEGTYLLMPNHDAVIDPIILFTEFYDRDFSPLVDEGYLKAPVIGSIVRLYGGIAVPDLTLSRRGVEQVRSLEHIALTELGKGHSLLLYPSGRITLDGRETIGNKRLAWKVCGELPKSVEVLGLRINGLWGSAFSRYGRSSTPPVVSTLVRSLPKLFCRRRPVTVEIIPITSSVREWSKLERREFNSRLEEFYNA